MSTALLTHPDCLGHITPDGHPERVDRLHAVLAALDGLALTRIAAPFAAEDDLLRCHPRGYVDGLRNASPARGWHTLDPDTHMSPGTLAAAMRAAGSVVNAVDLVMAGDATNAFCAVRPPGHHAEADIAMGFCLFGNVAIGAKHALDHHGLARVAIVDLDVHHGNGTQALLQDDPRVLFISTHEMPNYPGTGDPDDDGPHGTVLNIAMREGDGGPAFRLAFDRAIMPRLRAFKPDMLFISAGFDAHAADPLAGLTLQAADFGWMTAALCDLADECCQGRVVSVLEGGYDLDGLATSAKAHVTELMRRG
jgi:acetoin utilization deacetylase AcuC-like enzyme